MKKFYGVIGNPPYQEEVEGNGRATPIYPDFMDEAYKVGDRVELITPARFLFNAGQTKKAWNEKMLGDEHLKVLMYEPDGQRVFPGPEIKGGVAVTYRDESQTHEPIELFIAEDDLRSASAKVSAASSETLSSIVTGAVPYRFSDKVRTDHPELIDDIGKSFDLRTNSLDKLNGNLFFNERQDEAHDWAAIFGLLKGRRTSLWIDLTYLETPFNFDRYKVLVPKAIGSGEFGERFPDLIIAPPGMGHTQSFVSLGAFDNESEAKALERYLQTKLCRAMLGILKVTQDVNPRVFGRVPLQDFTSSSDIDWSQSVADIDRQLYAKYGLSDDEIAFIESHVKEMS